MAVFAWIVLGGMMGCHLAFPSYTHRYRLTLEAEADGEVRRGSGVVEVTWQRVPEDSKSGPWDEYVRGEAVVVDLGRDRVLLAGLYSSCCEIPAVRSPQLVFTAFGMKPQAPTKKNLTAIRRLRGQSRELRPEAMPSLKWLSDRADPATARPMRVRQMPSEIAPGVRLVRATVEVTEDRVTTGIGDRLPWVRDLWREHGASCSGRRDEFKICAGSLFVGGRWNSEP